MEILTKKTKQQGDAMMYFLSKSVKGNVSLTQLIHEDTCSEKSCHHELQPQIWRLRSRPETGSLLKTRAVCRSVASHQEGLMHPAISDFIQRTAWAKRPLKPSIGVES